MISMKGFRIISLIVYSNKLLPFLKKIFCLISINHMKIGFGFGPYLENTDVQSVQSVKKQEQILNKNTLESFRQI